uniref:Uncharacterized protein n=1 Tax=Trichobilharzia regenti TaxID=157069 RepID=A0AA85JSC7_TRIRE|nr:unnamed protein product [Trichobilharzia regenti]
MDSVGDLKIMVRVGRMTGVYQVFYHRASHTLPFSLVKPCWNTFSYPCGKRSVSTANVACSTRAGELVDIHGSDQIGSLSSTEMENNLRLVNVICNFAAKKVSQTDLERRFLSISEA